MDLKKIEKAIKQNKNVGKGSCPQRQNQTSFSSTYQPPTTGFKGKFGNYKGYPSKEAWSAAFKERRKEKRMERKIRYVTKEAKLTMLDRARKIADENMKLLEEVIANEEQPGAVRLQALQIALDRGYGKAAQTNVNINQNADAKAHEVDDEELRRRVEAGIQRLESVIGRTGEEEKSQEPPADIRKYN